MAERQPIERREVLYSGRVQGVGFRYTAQNIAHGYNITGYVCNLPDGRVQLVAEGTTGQLDRFLSQVRTTMASNISGCHLDKVSATGEFSEFAIRF